jgi:hypothetical protein
LNAEGEIAVRCTQPSPDSGGAHFVLDVDGYFQ